MTTNNELSRQIEKLTAEHNFKNEVAEILKGFDYLAFITEWKNKDQKRIIAKCKTKAEAAEVLAKYPATNNITSIGTATEKSHVEYENSFRIDIDNPPTYNSSQYYKYCISYESNGIDMQITIPVTEMPEFSERKERGITDSEYHYFTGVSMAKLRTMVVPCYVFKAPQVNWYGGNKTLKDVNEVECFINSLNN